MKFQSTLPRRERQILSCSPGLHCRFQSTLPRRERLGIFQTENAFIPFQSTLPRRERLEQTTILLDFCEFQSTLPRRERLADNVKVWCPLLISIHAPAKGATDVENETYRTLVNFNPRSREGSDITELYKMARILKFQSTLPRRERPKAKGKCK